METSLNRKNALLYRVAGQNPDFSSPPGKHHISVIIHPRNKSVSKIALFSDYTMELEWLLCMRVFRRHAIFDKCVGKSSVTFLHRGFRRGGVRDGLES